MTSLLLTAAVALLSTQTLGQQPGALPDPNAPIAPEATVNAAGETADPAKIICRSAAPPTGTRIQGRARQQLCMTKADWNLMALETEEAAKQIRAGEFDGPNENAPPN